MHARTAGDETNGYGLTVDARAGRLDVAVWGFWDAALAAGFVRDVATALRQVAAPPAVALDASRFKPQRPEGQQALRSVMGDLKTLGATGEVSVTNALTRIQLSRIMQESGVTAVSFR